MYCTRSNSSRSTRAKKVRRIFRRRMKFVIAEGGYCDYDDESIGEIEFPLRYIHLVQPCVPKELPQLDIDLLINGRMYHIST